MSFVHEEQEFQQLIGIVARDAAIAAALIEKDYWVTHTLWALHETGLELWFKGGTSLSKGFGLIQRFSEDLDLMIQPGNASGLPEVTNWTSTNKGPLRKRAAFYDALVEALVVPDVRVERDTSRIDKQARGADYLGHYSGALVDQLAPAMSPFVRLEVGRARVVPYVSRRLGSFVHTHLEDQSMLADYADNRPANVRCVHPIVTLFEKLDAVARRYSRDEMEADTFVRHYEDAAHIIRAADDLPDMGMTPADLAADMLTQKDIAALPTTEEPALRLAETDKRAEVERAYEKVAPMFWGPRIPLDECCSVSVLSNSSTAAPIYSASDQAWPYAWSYGTTGYAAIAFKLNQFSAGRTMYVRFRAKRANVISSWTNRYSVAFYNGSTIVDSGAFGPVPSTYQEAWAASNVANLNYSGGWNAVYASIVGDGYGHAPDLLDLNWILLEVR